MFQLSRGGRVFSDGHSETNSFIKRPSLAPHYPSPSSPSPPSTSRPSPLESLSSLVSQGLGVFGGSTPTISLPSLTNSFSSLAGILSEGLGLAQTFPHAGGLSRVDSLVSPVQLVHASDAVQSPIIKVSHNQNFQNRVQERLDSGYSFPCINTRGSNYYPRPLKATNVGPADIDVVCYPLHCCLHQNPLLIRWLASETI